MVRVKPEGKCTSSNSCDDGTLIGRIDGPPEDPCLKSLTFSCTKDDSILRNPTELDWRLVP